MPVELAFESLGEGPPVMILHGLFGAGRNWTQMAQALAATYRVILPDARNHGASPWAESMSYPDMALDVAALIEREGLQQPFVIGHSMGGKTAMALALTQPQAVAGVAVIDIAPQAYADQFRMAQGQCHGGLATHAVADQDRPLQLLAFDQGLHVERHLEIGHAARPGRGAMVAGIGQIDAVARGQRARDLAPVAAGAEQAVQDHHGRPRSQGLKG